MLNLFAYRATDPAEIAKRMGAGLPIIGDQNDLWLTSETEGRKTLCCWGAALFARGRAQAVETLLRGLDRTLLCLGTTRDGFPRHPLYLRSSTSLVPLTKRS